MENKIKETGKWAAKNNTPFSLMASVKRPPPYEKEVKCNYHIKDEDE